MRTFTRWVALTCLLWASEPLRCQFPPHDLSVHAEIVNQSYCHTDDESFSVQMRIKLRFTNVSNHRVILAKRVENPSIIRVAKTLQDARKGHFEYYPNVDFFPSELPASPPFGQEPDVEHFVILSVHQNYEATVLSGVFGAVIAAKAREGSGLLAKGKHVFQLGVGTWPYQWPYFDNGADVRALNKRWSRYGHLANGVLYSDFVPLTLPAQFDNPPCNTPPPP